MHVDNVIFKGLRKYKGLKLIDASKGICSSSALSQFESGKINLSETNKFSLLQKYGVKFIPQKEDLAYMRDKVENLKNLVRNFYVSSCKKFYETVVLREGYLYYDMNLLIDSFNILSMYETLYNQNAEMAYARMKVLEQVEDLMSQSQRKEYYFNIALIHLFLRHESEDVEIAFNKSFRNMIDSNDDFVMYWYAYSMKYFGKKMIAIKYYQEVERQFMMVNNFLGIQNVLLDLAELFLIVNETQIAQEYLDKYSDKRVLQKSSFAVNDGLYYAISGQIEFYKGKYRKALSNFQNALKCSYDYYIKTDLDDYIHVSMLDIYSHTDEEKYIKLADTMRNSYNAKVPSYLGAYFIRESLSEKEYEEYISKIIIPNRHLLSNRNYTMIVNRYKQYLTTKKRYSALTKIIL